MEGQESPNSHNAFSVNTAITATTCDDHLNKSGLTQYTLAKTLKSRRGNPL